METKTCPKCKRTFPISNFFKRSDRKSGYASYCKECSMKIITKWRNEHKDLVKSYKYSSHKELTHEQKLKKINTRKEWGNKNRERKWCLHTLSNHRRKSNIIVKLTTDELFNYVIGKTHCELCGKQINWNNNKMKDNSPTLDRVNNENFIDINNIQLVCQQCNTSKGARTMEELKQWCKIILERGK